MPYITKAIEYIGTKITTGLEAIRAKFDVQYRQHGASCDWDRFTFTLDEKVVKGAYKIFKKMWNEGLIYRSRKPVNYCVVHQTAFSGNDYEVEHVEREDKMYEIAYGLEDGGEVIVVIVI
jgi:valyl-tRNA synthetase